MSPLLQFAEDGVIDGTVHILLEQGLFSGVDFVATLHAATPEEATMRPQVKYLMERGAVRVLVWLTGRQAPGCIGEVRFL